MKIKIEADLALTDKQTLKAIANALLKKETIELLEAFPPGEYFKMEYSHHKAVIYGKQN